MHVRQAHVPAGVAVGQPLVVQAAQVQDRGPQVVHVTDVLHGVVAEVVRGAEDGAALHAAPGEEHAEPVGVVVAAVAALENGVRPNSPAQTWGLLQEPAGRRSLMSPAMGWSTW